MRKVILSMVTSVDGYVEGKNKDISWHVWDDEMQDYMCDFLDTVDTFFYGRISYQLMLDHWPTAEKGNQGKNEDLAFARKMNEMKKVVFSRTLEESSWNARIVKENVAEEVKRLKRQSGKDMVLLAGADIAATFMEHNLIDEYRLIISPVVLGKGKLLFKGGEHQFELVNTKTFNCGNVLLIYKSNKEL